MFNDILIFANPIAGKGRGKNLADRLQKRLSREGLTPRLYFQRPDIIDKTELAAVASTSRAAIVIGGDGTLRSVTSQLMALGAPPPPILVVPLGTANLMGQHLGISSDDDKLFENNVVSALRAANTIDLDAAQCNGHLFLLMAGVGIDGRIVHELQRMRRGPIDLTSYIMPAAIAISSYQYPSLTVTVDGQRIFGPRPAMAFVGNVKEYGTRFPILTHARSDDGVLDICVLPCDSAIKAARLFLHAVAGEHTQVNGVVYVKGRQVTITSDTEVPVQVDGEAAGHTPIHIDLLPQKFRFITPG